MKTIKATLNVNENIRLYLFADEHLGNPYSNVDRLQARVLQCANDKYGYAILNGDLAENITKSSLGDIYEQKIPPMTQIKIITDLFEPIKNKILCITRGNHENRTAANDGVDILRLIARQWNIEDKYSPDAALLFLRFGSTSSHNHKRKISYSIYISHGRGNGRTIGSKLGGLNDLATVCDADVYIHAHTHLPAAIKKDYYRTNAQTSSVKKVTRLFVNCAANLDYGGYAERAVYSPGATQMPVIELFNNVKIAKATV